MANSCSVGHCNCHGGCACQRISSYPRCLRSLVPQNIRIFFYLNVFFPACSIVNNSDMTWGCLRPLLDFSWSPCPCPSFSGHLRPLYQWISMVNWSLAPEDCGHRLSHPDSPWLGSSQTWVVHRATFPTEKKHSKRPEDIHFQGFNRNERHSCHTLHMFITGIWDMTLPLPW